MLKTQITVWTFRRFKVLFKSLSNYINESTNQRINQSVGACVHVPTPTHAMVFMQRSGNNFWRSVFSSHHTGPRNLTQIIQYGSRGLYLLSHLTLFILVQFLTFKFNFYCYFFYVHRRFVCIYVCAPYACTMPGGGGGRGGGLCQIS